MQTKNRHMVHFVNFINKYLGWRNWSVFTYNAAIENVFPIFYIALHDRLFSWCFVGDFFLFFLFSMFSTTYGYLVNDLSDKDLDRFHGKTNTFENDSSSKAVLIVIFSFLLSLLFAIDFWGKQGFLPLWLGWFLITTFYSLRPVRLKERGKVGLAFVVAAQRVLPTLIAFAVFAHWEIITVVAFTLYILFRGLSSDLNHQIEDYKRDATTGTGTYAVQSGFEATQKLFRISLETERILLFFCLLLMYLKLTTYQVFGVSLGLLPVIIYAPLLVTVWIRNKGKKPHVDINPFAAGRKDLLQFLHHAFPSVVLPVYLLFLLLMKNWIFVTILLFLVIYRKLYSPKLVMGSFPGKIFQKVFGIIR